MTPATGAEAGAGRVPRVSGSPPRVPGQPGVRPANPRDTASAPPAPATGDHAGFEPDACSETVGGPGGAARLGAPEAGPRGQRLLLHWTVRVASTQSDGGRWLP